MNIAMFQGKNIRKVLYNGEWWFSVVDVIAALTDSESPKKYWTAMKARVEIEGKFQLSTICRQLKMPGADGKMYFTDCADTEAMFRIVQSIPSPKAEPMKRWLAKVGFERVQEIEHPELAAKRMRTLYKLKGYDEEWIALRMRGIVVREELTDEWKDRGAQDQQDYEILTAEISKATFGVTPGQYKKMKGLKRENLRDHMDDFELIFSLLGEKATTEIHKVEDSKGVKKLKNDAEFGGKIAGDARKSLEKRIGKSIVTKENYLKSAQSVNRLKK